MYVNPCNSDRNLVLYPECMAHGFCHTFALAVAIMYVKRIHMPKCVLINQSVNSRCPINITGAEQQIALYLFGFCQFKQMIITNCIRLQYIHRTHAVILRTCQGCSMNDIVYIFLYLYRF